MADNFQQQLTEALLETFRQWNKEPGIASGAVLTEAQARINALLEEAMPEKRELHSQPEGYPHQWYRAHNAAIAETKQALGLEAQDESA